MLAALGLDSSALNGRKMQLKSLEAYADHMMAADLTHLLLTHKGQLLGHWAALVAHLGQLPLSMHLEPMRLACPAQRQLHQKHFQGPAQPQLTLAPISISAAALAGRFPCIALYS